jgi:multidrug resistance efflux pump
VSVQPCFSFSPRTPFLLRWGWPSGVSSVLIGLLLIATFLGLLNFLAPVGRLTISGRVVEVTPNVPGQVIEIPVEPNVLVRSGEILFKIDPTPYELKVSSLEAALAGARQKVEILKSTYAQATAIVSGLEADVAFNTRRLADIEQLVSRNATSAFQKEDRRNVLATLSAQLIAAKAAQDMARLSMESEIDGENTGVAQIQAQLESARWDLSQTTVRAPADGYATAITLPVGARVTQLRGVMSFIVAGDITLIGHFPQNGFQTIRVGAPVLAVFANKPGNVFHAEIIGIPMGVGQGQVAVAGTLPRAGDLGGASSFPAVLSMPAELPRDSLRLGMSGVGAAISPDAGPIGILATIMVWVQAYLAYL